MQKPTQQHIDQLQDLQTYPKIHQSLSQTQQHKPSEFPRLASQIRHILIGQPEHKVTLSKMYILQALCQLNSGSPSTMGAWFKCESVYQLVAVCQGYASRLGGTNEVRGWFGRGLKKCGGFWGVGGVQGVYKAILAKASPVVPKEIELQCKVYLWNFVKNNQQLFPSTYDISQYALKHMLQLKPSQPQQQSLHNQILSLFLAYPYNYRTVCKNFRFILQFFRSDKQIPYQTQLSVSLILRNYAVFQIDTMFASGSLGLVYSQSDVANCIGNVIKLGVTEYNFRVMKGFIQLFKGVKKYHELVLAFQKNISKIFVFLKYQPLYKPSLKYLKQLILGPYNSTSLYNIFTQKAAQFVKLKNPKQKPQQFKDFRLLLNCVVTKYKESILVTDLESIIRDSGSSETEEFTFEEIHRETIDYDWRVFEKIKGQGDGNSKSESNDKKQSNQIRGIVNIGNSCYMNSFLQCLYMTKQYRKKILEVSTLATQKQVLMKLQHLHRPPNSNQSSQSTQNLALQSRQTVRPLAQLQRTFCLLYKSKRPQINPTNIRNIAPVQFRNNHQHDSIEFGRFLIEAVSRSGIDCIFHGEMAVEIQCPYCGAKRDRREEFLDLMVECIGQKDKENESDRQGYNIEDLIGYSLRDQYIEGLQCQKCNNRGINRTEQQNPLKINNKTQQQNKKAQKQYNLLKQQAFNKIKEQKMQRSQIQNQLRMQKCEQRQKLQQDSEMIEQNKFQNNKEGKIDENIQMQVQMVNEPIKKVQNLQKNINEVIQQNSSTQIIAEQAISQPSHSQGIDSAQGQKSPTSSTKRHIITKFPSHLILTLKRFEYSMKQNKNIKKQCRVNFAEQFSLKQTEMAKQMKEGRVQEQKIQKENKEEERGQKDESQGDTVDYLIYSFIVHRGSSANSGHYFTFARVSLLEQNKQWVCLNDTSVSKLQDFSKVIDFLNLNQQDTPYIIFCIKKPHQKQNCLQLEKPVTLRPPLQNFIEKDDTEYIKSLSQASTNLGLDLSLLKFATGGQQFRKDEDGDGFGGFGGAGGFNNPIV